MKKFIPFALIAAFSFCANAQDAATNNVRKFQNNSSKEAQMIRGEKGGRLDMENEAERAEKREDRKEKFRNASPEERKQMREERREKMEERRNGMQQGSQSNKFVDERTDRQGGSSEMSDGAMNRGRGGEGMKINQDGSSVGPRGGDNSQMNRQGQQSGGAMQQAPQNRPQGAPQGSAPRQNVRGLR